MQKILNFLKSFFKKKGKTKVQKKKIGKKVGFVVGHNMLRQGAVSLLGESEYKFYKRMIKVLDKFPDVEIIYRDLIGIKGAYKKAQKSCCVVFELHFNSFKSSAATGCESLHSGRKEDIMLARKTNELMGKVIGNKKRPIKHRKYGQAGGLSCASFEGPNVLLEPFFGSNKIDAEKGNARMPELLERLYLLGKEFQ